MQLDALAGLLGRSGILQYIARIADRGADIAVRQRLLPFIGMELADMRRQLGDVLGGLFDILGLGRIEVGRRDAERGGILSVTQCYI